MLREVYIVSLKNLHALFYGIFEILISGSRFVVIAVQHCKLVQYNGYTVNL